MQEEPKKTSAQLKAERELMMAKAAIKLALQSYNYRFKQEAPPELREYWDSLSEQAWGEHLRLFAKELKKIKKVGVKKILFDLEHYINDCKKLVPKFKRKKEEILLMMALGQIDIKEFVDALETLPNNKEKLDRQIHKQIRELDWQDDIALSELDSLTRELDQDRIKKEDIDRIEREIERLEGEIAGRKSKRDELAIKLVEWRARGNMDIASADGKFRLDA
ncbi:MAG: hypothetical protein OXU45_03955 [Candidatus Melainabacteria bacterium]|nr:hypothetical protein [Candidatus Melainabacteria bacterium]